jgi:crossover junction endodeoxyribonuclease RuvC
MIILGLDPGVADTGYGILLVDGKTISVLHYGTIKTKKNTVFAIRLRELAGEVKKIINQYQPDAAAIERLFFYNNSKTAFAVGEARGVLTLTLANAGLPISEFTPLQVKQALTGSGKADKEQVQKMLKIVFKLKEQPRSDDAADALAVAYCCAVSAIPKN